MNYLGLGDIDLAGVDSALERFVRAQQERASGAGSHGRSLWNEVLTHTRSGKRLRSRLVLLAANGHGAGRTKQAGNAHVSSGAMQADDAANAVAAVYGLLHAAFILHDDVIDRDAMRYGRPSLHAEHAAGALSRGMSAESATHRGYSHSILAGDLALAAAYRLLLAGTCAIPAQAREQLQQILHDTVMTTTLGELLDVELSRAPDMAADTAAAPTSDPARGAHPGEASPTPDLRHEALRTAELKTAVYTFQAPLMSGALLAGMDASHVDAVGRIGKHLGMAYQLEDDVQGVFGDQEHTGKPVGGDLREGKHTYLIASALMSDHAAQVEELLCRAASADDADLQSITVSMRELLTRCGALEATNEQIRHHAQQAQEVLATVSFPEPLASTLRRLTIEGGAVR